MSIKFAVLGSGIVGETLANGILKHGYDVIRGSREPGKLTAWNEKAGPKASTASFAQAAAAGDIVILAVKGSVAESVVEMATLASMKGKTIIDACNPIAEAAPVNGVLQFFTGPNESLMERLQAKAPQAHFVKAFSCVGAAFMVNPDFGKERPTMFICGDDDGAKKKVSEILTQFGWDIADMGYKEGARAIEPLCMLWCIPGLLKNNWSHAFRLLKK